MGAIYMAYCNETQWQMYAQIYLDALGSRFTPLVVVE